MACGNGIEVCFASMVTVRSTTCVGCLVLIVLALFYFIFAKHEINMGISHSQSVPQRLESTIVSNNVVGNPMVQVTTDVVLSERKRLLFMTASYSFDQFHCLQKVLDCMRDICNAGWDVSVLIESASGLNYSHPRYKEIQDRAFCVRTGLYIPIIVEEFEKIGFGLNAKHRVYLAEHLNEFDYFSYAEEDMLLTVSHLTAFIEAQNKLRQHLGRSWIRYFIGFIRYVNASVAVNSCFLTCCVVVFIDMRIVLLIRSEPHGSTCHIR